MGCKDLPPNPQIELLKAPPHTTPMECRPKRYTGPMECMPGEVHADEVHANEMYVHGVYANKMYGRALHRHASHGHSFSGCASQVCVSRVYLSRRDVSHRQNLFVCPSLCFFIGVLTDALFFFEGFVSQACPSGCLLKVCFQRWPPLPTGASHRCAFQQPSPTGVSSQPVSYSRISHGVHHDVYLIAVSLMDMPLMACISQVCSSWACPS